MFVSCLLGATVFANTSATSKLVAWGKYLNHNQQSGDIVNDIYAQGRNVSISTKDIEQVKYFYILSGMDEAEAKEKAVQYVEERESLYLQAISNGYSATDEEVWAYIDELKEFINKADNKEDALAIMSQFESEEDYWNYEFTVYQKNLPIQNYMHDVEQRFMQTSAFSNSEPNAKEIAWQKYFEEMKSDLVNAQNFKIVNDK